MTSVLHKPDMLIPKMTGTHGLEAQHMLVVLHLIIWLLVCHSEDVLPSIHADKYYPCELVGTWNTWYGEQDQAGRITNINTHRHLRYNSAAIRTVCNQHACYTAYSRASTASIISCLAS